MSMAKTEPQQPQLPTSEVPERKPRKKKPTGPVVESRTVEMPFVDVIIGYVTNRCDVMTMTELQRTNLRKIQNGLIAKNATLMNGKRVRNGQDTVKWLLESLS